MVPHLPYMESNIKTPISMKTARWMILIFAYSELAYFTLPEDMFRFCGHFFEQNAVSDAPWSVNIGIFIHVYWILTSTCNFVKNKLRLKQ